LLLTAHPNLGQISDWTNSTVDRICDIIEGNGQQYLRDSKDYRKYLRQKKY
jgi:hypothetical protein